MKIINNKFITLMMSASILVGCNNNMTSKQSQTTDTPEDYSIPSIEYKYSEEEVNDFQNRVFAQDTNRYEGLVIPTKPILTEPEDLPSEFLYDSGINIAYPEDGVKGIYITEPNVLDEEYFNEIIDYINQTDLNAIVFNYKDDWGNILDDIESDNPDLNANVSGTIDYSTILKRMEENNIYPIARIVTFKDNRLAEIRPDLSFHDPMTGETWEAGDGAMFINPFLYESWDYVLQVAEKAAEAGFKDIQFDYIRFPEGFHVFSEDLEYDLGDYAHYVSDLPEEDGQERIYAIADFLEYAGERLKPYGVHVSADVFGYTAVAGNAADVRGIGQNFAMMAERVDVVSSMIYPSHWDFGFFGYDYPDMYPYEFTDTYMQEEEYVLSFVDNDVITRPWLQDFTYAYAPGFLEYGPYEVEAQIRALKDNGVNEFLLWNAAGEYSRGVNYNPEPSPSVIVE